MPTIILNQYDNTLEAQNCGLMLEINEAVYRLADEAESLLDGYTNNIAEQYAGVVAKCINAKRIFYGQRHAFDVRVNVAVICWNTGEFLRLMHKSLGNDVSPGKNSKNITNK